MNLNRLAPIATLPLRPFGLDPGRAIANAKPTPEQVAARRNEQLRYIVEHFPPPEGVETIKLTTAR